MNEVDIIIPIGLRFDPLDELHEEYRTALARAGAKLHFIYVVDGDVPGTEPVLEKLRAAGKNETKIIRLSRHFGEASAIMAGFSVSRSDRVLILPGYEQVEAGSLPALLRGLEQADLVTARRWPRRDSAHKRLLTTIFSRLVRMAGGSKFRDLGCGVHALRRSVLTETQLYGEQHRFLPMLAENNGFRVVELDLPQAERDAGRQLQGLSVYLQRLLDILTVFFLTRFTKRPLRFFGPIGAACGLLGGLALTIIIIQRFWFAMPLADRPALLLSSLLIALGLQIFAIGLVGELIVFINARSLRRYRIREIIENGESIVPG